jgi:RHS repeat-associated protein
MPNTSRDTVLCRYHYDPLDRQNGCTVLEQPVIQRFHCKSRLTTEIQGAARWSILQHDDQLLAQQNHLDAKVSTTLLATDLQRSVLNALDATQPHPLSYTPYGHRPVGNGLLSLLGFNGERPDTMTGHYHLGNGYRQFNPVLMRFNSPDSWSPFGEGGINAYAYCDGEPTNRRDPTGHTWGPIKSFLRMIGVMKKSVKTTTNADTGTWQNVQGQPGMVQLHQTKTPEREAMRLTKKEVTQFHNDVNKSYVEGQALDRKLALAKNASPPNTTTSNSHMRTGNQINSAQNNSIPLNETTSTGESRLHSRKRHTSLTGKPGEITRDEQSELRIRIANDRRKAGRIGASSPLGDVRQ